MCLTRLKTLILDPPTPGPGPDPGSGPGCTVERGLTGREPGADRAKVSGWIAAEGAGNDSEGEWEGLGGTGGGGRGCSERRSMVKRIVQGVVEGESGCP